MRERTTTVTVSYAQSVDGRIATATGDSRWISGPESLDFAHSLRGSHEAIMIGIGTVIADDPLLTCRLPECQSPHRFVLDSNLQMPSGANITRTADRVATTVVCAPDSFERYREHARRLESMGLRVETADRGPDGLDPRAVFDLLARDGIESLFVEGGSRLVTSLIREQLVDRLIVVFSPMIIGNGCNAIGELHVQLLADAVRAEPVSVTSYGRDIAWELRLPARREEARPLLHGGSENALARGTGRHE